MLNGNTAHSAHGEARAEHAANIMSAADLRKGYAELHANAFAKLDLKKFVVVNVDGHVIEAANEAKALLQNANGTTRHEDFIVIQDKIVEVRRRVLNGITDLMASGLVFDVSISEQLVGFENVNEFRAAGQEMNPNSYQNNDTVFAEDFVPNPITHSSFSVPWRQTGFDYKRSLGMTESVRQVGERLEETLFNGNTDIVVTFSGKQFG